MEQLIVDAIQHCETWHLLRKRATNRPIFSPPIEAKIRLIAAAEVSIVHDFTSTACPSNPRNTLLTTRTGGIVTATRKHKDNIRLYRHRRSVSLSPCPSFGPCIVVATMFLLRFLLFDTSNRERERKRKKLLILYTYRIKLGWQNFLFETIAQSRTHAEIEIEERRLGI